MKRKLCIVISLAVFLALAVSAAASARIDADARMTEVAIAQRVVALEQLVTSLLNRLAEAEQTLVRMGTGESTPTVVAGVTYIGDVAPADAGPFVPHIPVR